MYAFVLLDLIGASQFLMSLLGICHVSSINPFAKLSHAEQQRPQKGVLGQKTAPACHRQKLRKLPRSLVPHCKAQGLFPGQCYTCGCKRSTWRLSDSSCYHTFTTSQFYRSVTWNQAAHKLDQFPLGGKTQMTWVLNSIGRLLHFKHDTWWDFKSFSWWIMELDLLELMVSLLSW